MKNRISLIRNMVFNPIRMLAEQGKLSGLLLLAATFISIILTNIPSADTYLRLWAADASFAFLHFNVSEFVNDVLMPVFFLLVGLEIKRELVKGELSNIRQAVLPVAAAAGGMVFPAIIFLVLNFGNPLTAHGWAIPTATDIAFSLGVISLLGKRVPNSLVVFLMALAIIDDLGAILIIIIFYSGKLNFIMLILAAGIVGMLIIFNKLKIKNLSGYLIPGLFLWFVILNSGIHPTISGVLLAMTIPLEKGEGLEAKLTGIVSYFILPAFALANTAIPLSMNSLGSLTSNLSLGIILGLFLGKPIGILVSTFVLVKLGISKIPVGINWRMVAGLGLLAGIGFTMSIFIITLSFRSASLETTSKLAVIFGSLLSACSGIILLGKAIGKSLVTEP